MSAVFTATVGRSGSDHLARIINLFGVDCLAEHEPPELILARLDHLPILKHMRLFASQGRLSQIGRGLQRRHFFTDEMMGRGKAYEWLETGQHQRLRNIAEAKVRRIARILRRRSVYVEVSQYFIKTQAEFIHDLIPDMGIIKLTRHPLAAARSLANRDKGLFEGGPPPDWKQNILRIEDWSSLSRFQIFAHRWLETEARFEAFVRSRNIGRIIRLSMDDLNNPERLADMFSTFGIEHRKIRRTRPSNINRIRTVVGKGEQYEFQDLIDRLDATQIAKVESLRNYPDLGAAR